VAGSFHVLIDQWTSSTMKKTIFVILILAAVVFCVWLLLHQPTKQNVPPPTTPQLTNAVSTPPVSNAPPLTMPATNAFIRPDSIDEATWNRLMLVRQLALEQNQPIEFYARVVDQNGQPIEGARFALLLGRTDEKMFETTNFFHHQMGDEVLNIRFELVSDANGWIQITGTNGSFLEVWGLAKDGYLSSYPDGNFGGVHYEPRGARTPMGDTLMTNAWNPQKGYIFHLQKIEETNSVK
jgi:hypothetical protein